MTAEKDTGTLEVKVNGGTFIFTFKEINAKQWEYYREKSNGEIKQLNRTYGPEILALEIKKLYKEKKFQDKPNFVINYHNNHTQKDSETKVSGLIPQG